MKKARLRFVRKKFLHFWLPEKTRQQPYSSTDDQVRFQHSYNLSTFIAFLKASLFYIIKTLTVFNYTTLVI